MPLHSHQGVLSPHLAVHVPMCENPVLLSKETRPSAKICGANGTSLGIHSFMHSFIHPNSSIALHPMNAYNKRYEAAKGREIVLQASSTYEAPTDTYDFGLEA